MSGWDWALAGAGVLLALYLGAIAWLWRTGRREDARAVAGFVPDLVVLFRRLLGDARVPRRSKVVIALLVAYLASPIDLVPDFIPVAGQLDDAIIVILALRSVLRAVGPELLREHWRGPASSLELVLRYGHGRGR